MFNMYLKDIEFLKDIAKDLTLHANKNASKLNEFIKIQEDKRQKNVEKSNKLIIEKRKQNKLYGRSEKQLNYQKKNKNKGVIKDV